MITEETLTVLDEIEMLSDKILQSRLYKAYKTAEQTLANDDDIYQTA
jgi:hypothetical protein